MAARSLQAERDSDAKIHRVWRSGEGLRGSNHVWLSAAQLRLHRRGVKRRLHLACASTVSGFQVQRFSGPTPDDKRSNTYRMERAECRSRRQNVCRQCCDRQQISG